jgi:signal transduction histidine kinase
MIAHMRSFLLDRSILIQIGAVLIACQLVAHAMTISFTMWRFERPDLLTATSVSTVQAIGFYSVLAKAEPAERAVLEKAIQRSHPTVRLAAQGEQLGALGAPAWRNAMLDGLTKAMPEMSEKATALRTSVGDTGNDLIVIRFDDGGAFAFDPEVGKQRLTLPRLVVPLFLSMLALPLVVLALWGVRMLTAPLRQLAMSAERFSIDLDPTPLPAKGPAEIVKLAHAFNTMKGRIRQLVDSRSRMLAAVSHDLRTPLTRMKLRAEAQEDSEERDRTLRDIGTMDRMIGQSLSYLRDQASLAKPERTDLTTLVETVCNDFADMGKTVRFDGQRNIVLECEPDLLTRALSNLVDNAIKFGHKAEVTVAMRSAAEAVIHVLDEGPGIPDDDKFMVFEPFSRGDTSRTFEGTDGFGLGLAIARQIVERIGGSITLHDRLPHGLDVQIILPIKPHSRHQPGAKVQASAVYQESQMTA